MFRTTDGGATWKKVLYVNDGVGAIDLVINRKTPTTLYAAMYDKDRRPWQIVESGPESGVYKTDNGGDKWERLGGGLPTGKIGRIGLDIYQKNPLILYALLENQNHRSWRRRRQRGGGASAIIARWRRASSATSCIEQTMAARRGSKRDRRERGGRQGAVLVQSDQDQSVQRPDRDRDQRLDVHHARRRQDVEHGLLPRRVRRLPSRSGGMPTTNSESCSAATAA